MGDPRAVVEVVHGARILRGETRVEALAYDAVITLARHAVTQVTANATLDPAVLDARHPSWTVAVEDDLAPAIMAVYLEAYDAGTRHPDVLTPAIVAAATAAPDQVLAARIAASPHATRHLETVTNRLRGVPDTVFDTIRTSLDEGRQAGEDIPSLTRRVDSLLGDADRWRNRARVIARTEVIAANNGGLYDASSASAEAMGVRREQVAREWLATGGPRTRDTHAAATGQVVMGLDTPFTVGGASLLYPGDPSGPGSEVIQCRCTTLTHFPGDPGYPTDTTTTATTRPTEPALPDPEPEFVDRLTSDLDAGRITPDQLRAASAKASPLGQSNVNAAIARHEATQAAAQTAAREAAEAAAQARASADVASHGMLDDVLDAFTPKGRGSSYGSRDATVTALKQTPEGRSLLKVLDSFQSGSSSAIPRLRTDIEKYLAGDTSLAAGRVETIENLLRAVGNYETPDTVDLWRGMRMQGDLEDVVARYAAGDDLELSLASFTSDKRLGHSFAEAGGGAGQKFSAKNSTGVVINFVGDGRRALPIQNLGKSRVFNDEREWITAGKFRIVSVTKKRYKAKAGAHGHTGRKHDVDEDVVVLTIEQVRPW